MTDKLALSVIYQHRTIPLSRPAGTLVQSVLEDACGLLKIADPSKVKLVLEKGEKAIDHATTLRLANIKNATKLAIIPASPSRSSLVSVTLQCGESVFTASVSVRSSLWSVVEQFESAHGQQWTAWHGVPPPEVHAAFEVHINLPGYMQPVVEIGARRVATNEELRALTLLNLGLHSDTSAPSKLRLKLSHSYTPPPKTEEEQKAIIDDFNRKYAALTSAASASSASAPAAPIQPLLPLPLEEEEEDELDESDDDDLDEAPAFVIPSDRQTKIFHALPGLLQPAALPDEFYEVTEADSRAYARGIRAEVAKLARELTPEQAKAVGLEPATVGRNGLLDSNRLPPPPSAQERRNARVKRKCRASLIRVRLPNHLYAEALFSLEETPRELYAWLDSLLAERLAEKDAYYLFITPPRQVLLHTSKLTFTQLGLFPQALVHLGTESGREQAHANTAFTVAPDTPEEIAAKEQPAQGVIKQDRWPDVVKITPAASAQS